MTATNVNSKPIPKVRTRLWRSFERISQDIEDGFNTHGDLIQLTGFPVRVYCLRDPSQIEQVMRHPVVGITKLPSVFPRLKAMMPSSTVVVKGGKEWRECQDVMKRMFGVEYLQEYSAIIVELTRKMLDTRWKEYARRRKTFDIYEDIQCMLTEAAARVLFSKQLAEDQVATLSRKCSFLEFEFSKRLPPILPTAADSRYRAYMRELRALMRELLHERLSGSARRLDLLQILCDRSDSLSEDWIVDHMIEMWNSVRLVNPPSSLALQLLSQHPNVQDKLAREVAETDLGESPGFDETRSLPYLNMVLSEALRFYPSILLLPRWCSEGMSIDEVVIPPKSLVVPMIYHTHRHPSIYPDPLRFDPERWSPERDHLIHSHARLAFSAGRRGCLGVKMAKDMMRTLLATVIQNYRLEPVDVKRPATDVEISVHPSDPVWMRIIPRADNTQQESEPLLDTERLDPQPA